MAAFSLTELIFSFALASFVAYQATVNLTSWQKTAELKIRSRQIRLELERKVIQAESEGKIMEFQETHNKILFFPNGVCSPASIEIYKGTSSCRISLSLRCRVNQKC